MTWFGAVAEGGQDQLLRRCHTWSGECAQGLYRHVTWQECWQGCSQGGRALMEPMEPMDT